MLIVKQYKSLIVNAALIIVLIVATYLLYTMSKYSFVTTGTKIEKIFSNSNLSDPIIIWLCSSAFVIVFVCVLEIILPDRYFGVIASLKTGLATFGIIYVIYVGPIILFALLLLFNVSIIHITLLLSIISFLGVTFKKGKKLLCTIYNKIKDYI